MLISCEIKQKAVDMVFERTVAAAGSSGLDLNLRKEKVWTSYERGRGKVFGVTSALQKEGEYTRIGSDF